MKLLIGGSPCTHWSIAQKKDRETTPDGQGWELFKNYRIAKEKYRPNFFLYENNQSMSPAIKEQITRELGVEPIMINSALVSAQNRKRLYWTNIPGVEQPKDRGIMIRDILESGFPIVDDGHSPANGEAELVYSAVDIEANQTVRLAIEEMIQKKGYVSVMFNPYNRAEITKKSPTLSTGSMVTSSCATLVFQSADGKTRPAYKVQGGKIFIKGGEYPVNLPDGLYIIRKLTVRECKRLQTVPEWYIFPVSDTQAYKMLGNGWTVEVIAHILSFCPGLLDTPVEALSMYDGMSCGRLALEGLGAKISRYYATEIDKYAIKTTQANFPDTLQLGDAFQVREESWEIPEGREEHT